MCYPSDSNPEMGMLGVLLHRWVRRRVILQPVWSRGDEMPPLGEERPDNPVDEGVDEGALLQSVRATRPGRAQRVVSGP